ncbi:MAG TPA: hypothetical protein VLJ76_11235 [Gaiellaceae bacterium]|nr:hypothetical protein [Gaiellaceae bacterium]
MATAVGSERPEQLRDVARRLQAAQRLATVEAELEDAMVRRTELWHRQSMEPDPQIGVEIRKLSEEINRLWAESRARRATIRGGSRERILSRVRAEARFEREVKKVQGGAR